MKKFLKSLLAIILVVSIAFSASFVQAEAFTLGTLVVGGLIVGFLTYLGSEVVGELNNRKNLETENFTTNAKSNEWIYLKTDKNSTFAVYVNDGQKGDLVKIEVDHLNGSSWGPAKIDGDIWDRNNIYMPITVGLMPFRNLTYSVSDNKQLEVVTVDDLSNAQIYAGVYKGAAKFELRESTEYRIKVKGLNNKNFNNITIVTKNASISSSANNSKTDSSALAGSFTSIISKPKTYNSGNYKNNPSQAYNALSNIKFEDVSIDSSSGTVAKLSSTIKNTNAVRMSDYGVVLKESTGDGAHSDKKGSTSAKTINYSGSIKDLKPATSYTGMMFANTAYGAVCSPTFTFKTPLIKPPKAKISSAKVIDYRSNTETNSTEMGVGDNVSIKWNKADYADYYTISINGVEDKTQIKGTSKVLSFKDAGEKTIKVRAHNSVGSGDWSDAIKVTVHPDVKVTFYKDSDIYHEQTLTWGHDLITQPEVPVKYDSAFKGWYNAEGTAAVSFKNIQNDLNAHAAYNINKYKVQFVGPDGASLGKAQIVEHGKAAVEPDAERIKSVVKADRQFIGWDKDISCVVQNMTVTAVTDAKNRDIPFKITNASATRHSSHYVVTCTVDNITTSSKQTGEEVDSGRIVVALKTEEGKLVTTTESSAFYLKKDYTNGAGESTNETKAMEITVPLSENGVNYTASRAEIYAISDFQSLVPVSNGTVSDDEKTYVDIYDADPWSDWTTVDRAVADPQNKMTETWYQYSEYLTITTTSAAERDRLISEELWTPNETATETYKIKNTGTWTRTKPSSGKEGEDYEKKEVIDKKESTVYKYRTYKYYHKANKAWYYSYGRGYADSMGYSGEWLYKELNSPMSKVGTVDGYNKYDYSGDSHIWYSNGLNKKTEPKVVNEEQKHDEYRVFDTGYIYHLNKWSDFSGYQTEYTKDIPGKIKVLSTKVYRYKDEKPERKKDTTGEIRTDDFLIGSNEMYANKQLILAIYKVNEASDWTLEHIDQTVADENGTYEFDPYKLREEPSATTGDYTVVLGVEGSEKPIYLATIEAPKPKYTVKFVDGVTNEVLGDPQSVEEGSDAVAPEVPEHEGYTFSHWDNSTANIRHNFDEANGGCIRAIYTKNNYTVVWIDYVQGEYEIQTYEHGAELELPKLSVVDTAEMISEGWDNYVSGTHVPVTSNMVITAQYSYKTFTVDFLDFNGNVVDSQEVRYGETPELPEFDYEGEEDITFFGFTSKEEEQEGDLVTSAAELSGEEGTQEGTEAEGEQSDYIMLEDYSVYNNCTIVPSFEYAETTATPTVDVTTGTYSTAQTVTLECETEAATIFYTLDGSDPATSKTAIECGSPAVITISDSCQLRYYASAFNMNVSDEGREWYAINDGSETYKYIVKFAAYDEDNIVYTGLAEKGSLIDEKLISAVEGYTFSGAYKTADVEIDSETGELKDIIYSDKWNFATSTVTSDTVLYLDYSINTYTVEFVDYDGLILGDIQTVEYGGSATAPESPEREGYVFTGWDTEAYLDVSENLTVNAVYVPEDEYVTIELNRSSYTMMSGNTYTLKATTGGNVENPAVAWASSDENVAVVDDNGVVTATGKGSAEIYAIIVDNGETATCKINVVGNPSDEISIISGSHLGFDSYGYIRGFDVITDEETQEHHAESVAQVKSQLLNNNLVFISVDGTVLGDDDYVGTGTVIRLMNGEEELDSVTVVVSGDMDGDGYVTNRDASRISRYLVDKESPTEVQIFAMDVNGDGYVNNRDAAVVSRYLVGKEAI